ncbi:hypothetical protein [Victivallis vadensis]|uniref:Uncharacterized protein n=1 Tax=Victivallis vadensis TaxID=172901 RepID=A0A2U1AQD2_9BACT|nr:hypothetical protein [Victivallis vadensis]PVY38595.1 hypothetical protein C8D82_12520 [Victivallis vadensis]
MSITVKQAWTGVDLSLEQGSGSNSNSTATVTYIVEGTEDDITACTSAYEFAPDEFSEIPKKSASVAERLTENAWKIEVNYGSESKSSSGESGSEDDEATMNFDCSAGTKHMTQAIEQTCVYAGSGESKDSSDEASAVPIGWNGKDGSESEAAGVDVSIGELRETYTKTMSKSKVTGTSWKRKVAELVGKVNSGSFKGWNAGEVMFLGCSYSAPSKGSKKVSVSFHFAIRLNESKATVAGQNIGSKKGFEYLWALTDDEVRDGERKRKVRKIYKAVVCETDGFGGLGI